MKQKQKYHKQQIKRESISKPTYAESQNVRPSLLELRGMPNPKTTCTHKV